MLGSGKEESKAPQRKWIVYIYFPSEVRGCLNSNFVKTVVKKLLLSFDLNGWNAIYCHEFFVHLGKSLF